MGSVFSGQLFAQQSCPAVNSVKKWEVISLQELLAYDHNDQYYFFMNIRYSPSPSHKVGGPITLRFFSSTICNGDTLVINGQKTTVEWLKEIRR